MHLYMCCVLYYHFVYGVLSHYVDMILIVYGVMYWQSCVFTTVLLYCIYIWNVYLDYFYIYGDCSPVRFLEVNKEMKWNENMYLLASITILTLYSVLLILYLYWLFHILDCTGFMEIKNDDDEFSHITLQFF
jgi:hypothetical protein